MATPPVLPHNHVPSKEPLPAIAPLPPLPTPTNLRSGYNPSTSSSPAPSPMESPSSSPQRPSRVHTLAPPGSRPRVSRSASPLARDREPMLPDLERDLVRDTHRKEAEAICAQHGFSEAQEIEASTVKARPAQVARTKSATDVATDALRVPSASTSHTSLRPPVNFNFSRPLSHVSTLGSRTSASATATPLARTAAVTRQTGSQSAKAPPPPISVPRPPTPEASPDHSYNSASRTSQNDNGNRSSQLSQASHVSQTSIASQTSQTSQNSSQRSSVDSESTASSRTVLANKSTKQSSKGLKSKKKSKFLKRKTVVEPISKPMISPPTLIHSGSTSQLPALRNRSSMGAEVEDNMGNENAVQAEDAASKEKQRNDDNRRQLNKADTTASTTSTIPDDRPKMRKNKTFGLPRAKDQRRPEDVDQLLSSGFFTRTQLPPVKYTRLPVLAVSGSDIEKAQADAGPGVRVSMDLAPVVWYEGRRKTLRMSWRVKQDIREEPSENRKDHPASDVVETKTTRTSWIPGHRFSWLPGEEDVAHLKSPMQATKSPKRSSLGTVGEEHEESDTESKDRPCVEESSQGESNQDRLEDACLDTATNEKASTIRKSDSSSKAKKPIWSFTDSMREVDAIGGDKAAEEAEPKMCVVEKATKQGEGRPSMELRDRDNTELAKVLERIAEEQEKEDEGSQDGIDAVMANSTFDMAGVPSNRFSVSIRRLNEALATSTDHERDETEQKDSIAEEELARHAIQRNRTSWMLNTGAPSPQEVKILAAVPKKGVEPEGSVNEELLTRAVDAAMELKILSAYELPTQAQVLAVIAEENEEEALASVEEVGDAKYERDKVHNADWPMLVSSPGLPSMRMIGMAAVEEGSEYFQSEVCSASSHSDSESVDNSISEDDWNDSKDKDASLKVMNKGDVIKSEAIQEGSSVIQPLQIRPREEKTPTPETLGLPPYVPGPTRLMGPDEVYRRGSIAGMDLWNDNDTSESAWQRSEKALIDGILDFFQTVVSTSETISGAQESLFTEDEEDLSFLKAPLLDDEFIREHAVDDIFAKRIDPSKPPPLPPLPTNLPIIPQRTLPSPGMELLKSPDSIRSVASSTSSGGSLGRMSSTKKHKPVAVHSPGLGTLILKRGIF